MAKARLVSVRRKEPWGPQGLTSVRKVPNGKGIFVRGIASVGGVERIVSQAKWAGLRWVAVQSWWKDMSASGSYNPNGLLMPQLASLLRSHGIDFWVWGWPYPWQSNAFSITVGGAARLGTGAILDLEGAEWNGKDAAAVELVARMRHDLRGRGLGLTSYGRPSNFPDFPWSTAPLFDFGMPQVYVGHKVYGPGFQAQGVADYAELGFKKVVPLLGAYDLTPAEMTAVYALTPQPAGGVGWWDFTNADAERGRWAAIRQAQGVRFAAWWSKRPSPLDPQDAPAPRPRAWLGQRRRRASRLSLYR